MTTIRAGAKVDGDHPGLRDGFVKDQCDADEKPGFAEDDTSQY